MIEQIYPHIYSNPIPLPKNPLKALNSYIIVSPERNLIIDTGFNQPECIEAFFGGVAELGIDLAKTDILLTHRHSDHTGLASLLEERGAQIYAGAQETVAIAETSGTEAWVKMERLVTLYGLHEYGITMHDHPGYTYRSPSIAQCIPLAEGSSLHYGDYEFTVVDIPGHTPGHIGLYEANRRLFFGGDHVLASITPNITYWGEEQDSLAQYIASLRKVKAMPIDLLFTAHRDIVRAHAARIDQLLGHHEKRLAEIIGILRDGAKRVCQVAAEMKWEIRAKSWDDFPKAQKWFASGEAASHLAYLYNTGHIQRTIVEGTFRYQLSSPVMEAEQFIK